MGMPPKKNDPSPHLGDVVGVDRVLPPPRGSCPPTGQSARTTVWVTAPQRDPSASPGWCGKLHGEDYVRPDFRPGCQPGAAHTSKVVAPAVTSSTAGAIGSAKAYPQQVRGGTARPRAAQEGRVGGREEEIGFQGLPYSPGQSRGRGPRGGRGGGGLARRGGGGQGLLAAGGARKTMVPKCSGLQG